jgi:hypothetical protein
MALLLISSFSIESLTVVVELYKDYTLLIGPDNKPDKQLGPPTRHISQD